LAPPQAGQRGTTVAAHRHNASTSPESICAVHAHRPAGSGRCPASPVRWRRIPRLNPIRAVRRRRLSHVSLLVQARAGSHGRSV